LKHLKHLILEAHRRSLWQVVGVYLVSAWLVLQVVDTVSGVLGLPDWVPPFALVLILVGLPIVVATALVQEGAPGQAAAKEAAAEETSPYPIPPASPERSRLQRHLTWKRSLWGGAAAFGLLVLLVAGYFASWSLGIGPVGSLLAAGELEEGDRIVLADFRAPANDPDLGMAVTDALRIDLLEHPTIRIAEDQEIRESLQRMQEEPGSLLTPELAREVALREGMKGVLEGQVSAVGTGYALSAMLRSAESGEQLAAFRETAEGPDRLLAAIDRLSESIRERAGESLRSIRSGSRLENVTTSSLDALLRFSRANRAEAQGDLDGAIRLFEEALELDPEFAMAWRRLAVVLSNRGLDRARVAEAATRAYELRDRVSQRERYMAEGFYHREVAQDGERSMRAYRALLDLDPEYTAALNNLAVLYMWVQDYEAASDLLEQGAQLPGAATVTFQNLTATRILEGRPERARESLEALRERYPDHPVERMSALVRLHLGDELGARRALEGRLSDPSVGPFLRWEAHSLLGFLDMRQGRVLDARQRFAAAEREADEVGGELRWRSRLLEAAAEVTLGSPERGAAIILDGREGGTVEALSLEERDHLYQATLLAAAGRIDVARSVLAAWETEVPAEQRGGEDQIMGGIALALIQLREGRPEEAVRTLQGLRSTFSCPTCEAWVMGWALREAGRLEEAAEEWERAASPGGAVSVALASQSFALWESPLMTVPPWVMDRLAPLYEEMGEPDRALGHYRRLAELWSDADPELEERVERIHDRIEALESSDP
jgi:eukaryotic-like serine/threonine-protein kinase